MPMGGDRADSLPVMPEPDPSVEGPRPCHRQRFGADCWQRSLPRCSSSFGPIEIGALSEHMGVRPVLPLRAALGVLALEDLSMLDGPSRITNFGC